MNDKENKPNVMDVDITSKRLKELREKNKLTQLELARALIAKYELKNKKGEPLEDASMLASIKKYEADEFHSNYGSVAGMATKTLFMFADFYDIPTDYILGKSDVEKATNDKINKRLGLIDNSIGNLEMCCDRNPCLIDTINFLLTSEKFWNFLDLITTYRYYTPVIMTMFQNLDTFDKAMLELKKQIKEAENAGDMKTVKELNEKISILVELLGYYPPEKKKKITPEKIDRLSLFEISELSKEIAKEYQKQNEENEKQKNTTNNKRKK